MPEIVEMFPVELVDSGDSGDIGLEELPAKIVVEGTDLLPVTEIVEMFPGGLVDSGDTVEIILVELPV